MGRPDISQGWLRAFQHSNFRRAWTVAAAVYFGYWLVAIPLQWMVAEETSNDPFAVSLLFFAVLFPLTILSMPAGVLADRWDRRWVVGLAQVGAVLTSVCAVALVVLGSVTVTQLMIIGVAVGTFHAISNPAATALIGSSVPAVDLPSAAPLQTMAANLGRLIGPALAGVAILVAGNGFSIAIYGFLGLMAVIMLTRLPAQSPKNTDAHPGPATGQEHWGIWMKRGLDHARSRPPAMLAILIVAVSTTFGSSYLGMLPVIASYSGQSEGSFVILTSAGGVGSVITVIFIAIRGGSKPHVTSAASMLLVLGFVVAALGSTRLLWVDIFLVAAAGGLQFGVFTVCGRVLQQIVDDQFRGRVMSMYFFAWGGLLPIGALILGVLTSALGVTIALVISGGVAFILGLLTWVHARGLSHRA